MAAWVIMTEIRAPSPSPTIATTAQRVAHFIKITKIFCRSQPFYDAEPTGGPFVIWRSLPPNGVLSLFLVLVLVLVRSTGPTRVSCVFWPELCSCGWAKMFYCQLGNAKVARGRLPDLSCLNKFKREREREIWHEALHHWSSDPLSHRGSFEWNASADKANTGDLYNKGWVVVPKFGTDRQDTCQAWRKQNWHLYWCVPVPN